MLLIGLLVFAVFVSPTSASEHLGDRDVSFLSLKVNGRGEALVSYRKAGGARRDVLIWGAVNAHAPDPARPQVKFRMDYTGGTRTHGSAYAGSFRNKCRAYDGPRLVMFVAGCKAPDGSYWALQRWQRLKPNYGGDRGAWELRLSHWAGPLPRLELWTDWAYRRFDHLYGRYSYQGEPVHGFRTTPQGEPLDPYGRNLYVDTYDSRYGRGWRRENSFLAQRPNGAVCYGFYPHGGRPAGEGVRYRASVIGPGVTPDVTWQAPAPVPFDAARERRANAHQRQLFAGSAGNGCRPR